MNITANTAAPASAGASATPAAAGSAQDLAFDPALAGAPAAAAFAQWLAVGDLAAAAPADPAGALAMPDTPPDDGADVKDDAGQDLPAADAGAALPQDVPMLAAMAMPLMASIPAPAPAAAPSIPAGTDLLAVGGAAPAPAASDGARRAHTDAAPAGAAQPALDTAAAAQAAGAAALAAAEPRIGGAGRNPSRTAPEVPSTAPAPASAAAAAPAAPAAAAANAQAASGAATAATRAGDAVAATDKADVAPAGSGGWGVGPSTAPAQARPADTVALAGPPQAWRQTLHEALGERLQMQVGNNLEQAVIRLDPPNLGRIEIAIRHSGGNLEVTLSATHSEVVRQLHTVSDTLRHDLAQRQYSEVAVTVSQAPRAQQPGQSSFADQQGRQRQDGRKQEESDPGQALADAGNPTSTFSLNGRE